MGYWCRSNDETTHVCVQVSKILAQHQSYTDIESLYKIKDENHRQLLWNGLILKTYLKDMDFLKVILGGYS